MSKDHKLMFKNLFYSTLYTLVIKTEKLLLETLVIQYTPKSQSKSLNNANCKMLKKILNKFKSFSTIILGIF